MKYSSRKKKDIALAMRFPRVEQLETRLPFAADAIPMESADWMMPAVDVWQVDVQQLILAPAIIEFDFGVEAAVDPLPIDSVFATSDPLEPIMLAGDASEDYIAVLAHSIAVLGTTAYHADAPQSAVIDVASLSGISSRSTDSDPVKFSSEEIDLDWIEQDWFFNASSPWAAPLPFNTLVFDGFAIPADYLDLTIIEGQVASVWATSDFVSIVPVLSDFHEHAIGRADSRLEHNALIYNLHASANSDILLVNQAVLSILGHRDWQISPLHVSGENEWKLKEQSGSHLSQGFRQDDPAKQSYLHYQTFGELLQLRGIDLASETPFTQDRNHAKALASSQKLDGQHGFKVDAAPYNGTLPFHILPEGMLAIGAEAAAQNYHRLPGLKLNEDFVAQTELICADLRSVVTESAENPETPEETNLSFGLSDPVQWVAIGSTIVITRASLLTRKSRENSTLGWYIAILPKFRKHPHNESL